MARAEGDAARAEGLLREREKRVRKLDITPLTTQQRDEFADEWEKVQAQFVDDPTAAVVHADALVQLVRLSGRQMKHRVESTAPALLAGLERLLAIDDLMRVERYSSLEALYLA